MGPKKNGVSRTVLTIKTKQEIIANVESGQKAADVARQYGLNRSTVSRMSSSGENNLCFILSVT